MDQQQQQVGIVMAPPVPYQTPPTVNEPPRNRYKEHAGRTTGKIQIFCGLTSMAFGVVALLALFGIVPDGSFYWDGVVFAVVAWPIWGGVVSSYFFSSIYL